MNYDSEIKKEASWPAEPPKEEESAPGLEESGKESGEGASEESTGIDPLEESDLSEEDPLNLFAPGKSDDSKEEEKAEKENPPEPREKKRKETPEKGKKSEEKKDPEKKEEKDSSGENKKGLLLKLKGLLSQKAALYLLIALANISLLSLAAIVSLCLFTKGNRIPPKESAPLEKEKENQRSIPEELDLPACARKAYERGEWESVLALYEKAFRSGVLEDPQDRIGAFMKMGEAYLKLGNKKKAFESFQKATGEMEKSTRFGSLLENAERHMEREDYIAARRTYYSFLARSAEVPAENKDQLIQAHLRLAETYIKEYERNNPQKEIEDDLPWDN